MPIQQTFSKALYHARNKQKLTQKQVADAVSVSVRWYQRIESGEKLPGTLVMLRLILLLGLDVEGLRGEVGLILPEKK